MIAQAQGLTVVNSRRPGLQASINVDPSVAATELSTFPSILPFRSGLELGASRLSRSELYVLTLQELSAGRFSNQELGTSTLPRQELASSLNLERVDRSGGGSAE